MREKERKGVTWKEDLRVEDFRAASFALEIANNSLIASSAIVGPVSPAEEPSLCSIAAPHLLQVRHNPALAWLHCLDRSIAMRRRAAPLQLPANFLVP